MSISIHNYNCKVVFDKDFEDRFGPTPITLSLMKVASDLRLNIVKHVVHMFNRPIENSGVFILSTSHLAWHTYPEERFITVDINTCGGELSISDIEESFKKHLKCVQVLIEKSVFV